MEIYISYAKGGIGRYGESNTSLKLEMGRPKEDEPRSDVVVGPLFYPVYMGGLPRTWWGKVDLRYTVGESVGIPEREWEMMRRYPI